MDDYGRRAELDALRVAVAQEVMGWENVAEAGMFTRYHPLMICGNVPGIREILPVPDYSRDWNAAAEVLRHIRATWIFSHRRRFNLAIQRIISERLGMTSRIHDSEILLHVEPVDICRAAVHTVRWERQD
jgi:hypothetical protein